MAIPDYNSIKLPALRALSDSKPRLVSELYRSLAPQFNLTDVELEEMLPSGTQRRWHNRVNWACYDLYKAGILERPKRGTYLITTLGKKLLSQNPTSLDRDYLQENFASFQKWLEKRPESSEAAPPSDVGSPSVTPEEQMSSAYRILNEDLRGEILQAVRKMDPYRFERLVLDLLLGMGYGGSREEAATVTQKSGDEGIDGLINEDRLGLDRIYVQAKRWKNTVGRPDIQNFVGALAGKHASKGIFITTSEFAGNATEFANSISQRVILIDGDRLADLMVQHNIGVASVQTFELKRVDTDYFDDPER